jgi:hypothetical protein
MIATISEGLAFLVGVGVWLMVTIGLMVLFEKPYHAVNEALGPYRVAGTLWGIVCLLAGGAWLFTGWLAVSNWFAVHVTLSLWLGEVVAALFVGFWVVWFIWMIVTAVREPRSRPEEPEQTQFDLEGKTVTEHEGREP